MLTTPSMFLCLVLSEIFFEQFNMEVTLTRQLPSVRSLETLPDGVLHIIVNYLPLQDFLSFTRLSKRFSNFGYEVRHLEELYQSKALFKKPGLFKRYLDSQLSFDCTKALLFASAHEYTDIIRMLLEYKNVDPSVNDNVVLLNAVNNGHGDIVEMLLNDSRVDPSVNCNQAILVATNYGYTDIVGMLLKDSRVNPSQQNNRALMIAVDHDYIDIVRLLLNDKRVDPCARENQALKKARQNVCEEILELLMNDARVSGSVYHH
ncbi:hypothetical protein BC833DRAFT_312680 [Globomyces pollinis-pini]|nr:hypothetical protein BC833DRAFT_312680 [Globomyces pollinis-pini]